MSALAAVAEQGWNQGLIGQPWTAGEEQGRSIQPQAARAGLRLNMSALAAVAEQG